RHPRKRVETHRHHRTKGDGFPPALRASTHPTPRASRLPRRKTLNVQPIFWAWENGMKAAGKKVARKPAGKLAKKAVAKAAARKPAPKKPAAKPKAPARTPSSNGGPGTWNFNTIAHQMNEVSGGMRAGT